MNRYYIENGKIFEWNSKQQAYICKGLTIHYTKKQIQEMKESQCNKDDNDSIIYFD